MAIHKKIDELLALVPEKDRKQALGLIQDLLVLARQQGEDSEARFPRGSGDMGR